MFNIHKAIHTITIQNAFFFFRIICPFFDLDFLSSVKHPIAKQAPHSRALAPTCGALILYLYIYCLPFLHTSYVIQSSLLSMRWSGWVFSLASSQEKIEEIAMPTASLSHVQKDFAIHISFLKNLLKNLKVARQLGQVTRKYFDGVIPLFLLFYAPALIDRGHLGFGPSVHLFVYLFVSKNFFIGHIFRLVCVGAFIFYTSIPCDKTFLLVQSSRSSVKVKVKYQV